MSAVVPNNVGDPLLPESGPPEKHESANAGLWKAAIEAMRVAAEADERVLRSDKPAAFAEYVGRITRCGGALIHSGIRQGGSAYRRAVPMRFGKDGHGKGPGCPNTAEPKYGICESCQIEEREDRLRIQSMGERPIDDEPRKARKFT